MNKFRKVCLWLLAFTSSAALLAACNNEGATPGGDGENPGGDNKPPVVTPIAPESILLNNLTGNDDGDEGEGTVASPYTVSVATGKSTNHNVTVRPQGADATFTWTVGEIADDVFTAAETSLISVSQTQTSLTITAGETAGDYYVKGEAQTGELEVYLKVTVFEYNALESLTLNGFTKVEGKEYDYEFKTAKGTTCDINKGITKRGQDLLDGKIFGGNQKPLHLSYFSNVYKFEFTPTPANATDTAWIMTAEDKDIFNAESDGSWSADKAGETIVTVTNGAGEASVKIKVEVIDTVYSGILKSEYDAYTAHTNLDWYFDGDADDKALTLERLDAWNLIVNKTTSAVNGDDTNQKIFYLGDPDRPYGIDLESRIDSKTGVTPGTTLATAWTKAAIPAGADKLFAVIGNNGKSINRYRISMVEGDGTVHAVTDGWVDKEADGTGTTVNYAVPAACKGKTVAIVIESTLTEAGENCEMHIKGVWITLPVSGVAFDEAETELSQGSSFQLEPTLSPSKVIDGTLNYSLTSYPAGGEGKITVSESGLLTVATDAPQGDYVVTAVSATNENATAAFTVHVTGYVELTGFSGEYTDRDGGVKDLNGASFNEKQGAAGYVLNFAYTPDNASVQDYDVTYSQEGLVSIITAENDRHELVTTLNFIAPTDGAPVTVTITPKAAEGANLAITFNVTVREGVVLDWSNKSAILKEDGGGKEKRNGNVNVWFAKNITLREGDTTLALNVVGGAKSKLSMYVDGKYVVVYDWIKSDSLGAQTYDIAELCKDAGVDSLAGKNVTFVFEVRDNAQGEDGVKQDYALDYFRISNGN